MEEDGDVSGGGGGDENATHLDPDAGQQVL